MSKWWPKVLVVVVLLLGLLVPARNSYLIKATEPTASAAANVQPAKPVPIYFFHSDTCPHCQNEKAFLEQINEQYDELKVYGFEINSSSANIQLMQEVGRQLDTSVRGVPLTVVGNQPFIGYLNDETSGQEILNAALKCSQNDCPDIMVAIGLKDDPQENNPGQINPVEKPSTPENQDISLPIMGTVSSKQFSLPVLTFLIALLDGFNPCAMWTLLFLISLLLGMKDRRRMWMLGTAFIVSSAAVYFLFLTAWLNLFLFLGFTLWVRLLIGVVAIGAGIYNLYDFCTNKDGGCHVSQSKKRKAVFNQLKDITHKKQLWLALGGIILLAIAVNMVELVCSAGLPAVFTQLLAINNLPAWQYYAYMLFYILVFMLDDLFVFFAAMTTLHMVGIESKYARYSRLIGGILILAIGILLILKPEWLTFA